MPSDLRRHQSKSGRTMDVFLCEPLQGVIPSSPISWELASVKLYKTSLFKFIPFSERCMSIFIWKDKDTRFNLEISVKNWTSKIAMNLMVYTTNVK